MREVEGYVVMVMCEGDEPLVIPATAIYLDDEGLD